MVMMIISYKALNLEMNHHCNFNSLFIHDKVISYDYFIYLFFFHVEL